MPLVAETCRKVKVYVTLTILLCARVDLTANTVHSMTDIKFLLQYVPRMSESCSRHEGKNNASMVVVQKLGGKGQLRRPRHRRKETYLVLNK